LSAGSYSWTVRDANGCEVSGSETVNQPTALVASDSHVDVLCNGDANGSVTITFSGGTAPYQVSFNGGAFAPETSPKVYNGLSAGSYSWTVRDANGCEVSGSETVTEPTVLVASDSHVDILCNGDSTGSVTITFSGGTAPYQVSFNGGAFASATSPSVYSNLSAGSYNWTVRDANGCEVSGSETIAQPEALLATNVSVEDDNCEDDVCNGSLTVTVTGGTAPYTYQWNDGYGSGTSADGVIAINNICTGYYLVNISDANGCRISDYNGFVDCRPGDCGPHKTFTQGGWGAVPNGNNAGVYLHANFSSAFPSGLTIGCESNTLTFTSAQQITDYLPDGSTPSALPETTVLSAQLVAASLNIGFDSYDANFAGSDVELADMIFNVPGFEGLSAGEVLAIANDVIGGCSNEYSYSDLTAILTILNENFDNGTVDNGNLDCPSSSASNRNLILSNNEVAEMSVSVYPNPAIESTTIAINNAKAGSYAVEVYSLTGDLVMIQQHQLTEGNQIVSLDVTSLASQLYIVSVKGGNHSFTQKLQVSK
jgi:hypothetical protein